MSSTGVAFILQRDLEEFETHLAEYLGVKHAIGLGNCTDALMLAVRAAGIRPGDEVIFPSHTMVISPSAIYWLGTTPVSVDCGSDHLIDPASVRNAITPRTKAGCFGLAAAVNFYPAKVLGCFGDMDDGVRPRVFRRMGLRAGFSSLVGDQHCLRTMYGLDEQAVIVTVLTAGGVPSLQQ
ncbi:MAG TPA: aminotransferase class I/II-fold pyridoxal phosphate-dependent enzyme [Armatimonadota bacterium]|nr:aminotransferase class I/II-fold pyridoxal phosphate-dependent enzyme [Armatimonadota bacterium]